MCERLLADALYARAFHYSIVPMMSLADDVILSNFTQAALKQLLHSYYVSITTLNDHHHYNFHRVKALRLI